MRPPSISAPACSPRPSCSRATESQRSSRSWSEGGQGAPISRRSAAAAALRREIGAPCPPSDQERLDRWLSVAREQLGRGEQAGAEMLGGLMKVEDALREFLR